jgi:chain length determinant protein tyrosine kinase EpsG
MNFPYQKFPSTPMQPLDVEEDGKPQVLDRSIGDFIRQIRSLSDEQVQRIAAYQREHGLRFGESAIALKLASRDDVLWALSQQFHYPYAAREGANFNEELVAAIDPFCDQAEAFRELRSQLMMGVMSGDGPRRALAVLSPDSGDGKSFFASNMAITFSQLGGRTLLVDADMRTPRQHSLFGVANHSGLSSILSGRADVDAIHQVQDLPSLYVLPVGTTPPNPLELVQRASFGLLLQELLSKFDHVVVDTPAAAHGADARVIAVKCGAAMVIARRGKTRMKPTQALVNALSKTPTKLAGVMFNEH